MDGFVTVGREADHPQGQVRAYDVGGRAVAVASTDGGWFGVDDTCTHRGCSLAEGELEGLSLICPCHMGEYDLRTGEVLDGPPPEPLRPYEVRVEDGEIRVATTAEGG